MANELERMTKEDFPIHLRHYTGIFLEGLRNTTKSFIQVAGEIKTGHFSDASQRRCCYSQLNG
jgi:hypothetical protein